MTSNRSFKWVLAATAVAVLGACGGGSSPPPDTKADPIMFSGKVIDGYIEGAKVCLDLNANQACDAGEPSDTSKAGGGFSLDVSGITAAQLATAHLLTTVPTTAKDADDAGKTLAEAGKLGFSLMAPATAFSSADGKTLSAAVISPLTTLVSHDMIAGNNKPLAAAQAAVVMRMSLPVGTNVNQDFVVSNNSNLQNQARVIAVAIASVSNTVKTTVAGTTDRVALLAALTYLQQNVAALVQAVQAAPPSTTQTTTQLVNTALATSALLPVPANLASAAQQITASSAADIVTLLADGLYWANCLSQTNCGSARYDKTSGSNGQWTGSRYALVNNAWALATDTPSYVLKTAGWVLGTAAKSGTFTSDGQGGGTATEDGGGRSFRFSARSVDLSGATFGSVAGLQAPAALAGSVFPSGSKLFWMQFSALADDYRLYSGNQVNQVVCTATGCPNTVLANIAELISANATANNSYRQWNNLVFSFNAGGTATGGTVSLWGPIPSVCTTSPCLRTKTGAASYEIRTVSGQQILIINSPAPNGEYVMFSAVGGNLYGGSYTPAGIFTNSEADYNKTALNAILSAAGKPAVVN